MVTSMDEAILEENIFEKYLLVTVYISTFQSQMNFLVIPNH